MTQDVRTIKLHGKEYVEVAERVRLAHADEQAQGFSVVEKERYELAGRYFYSVTIEVKGKQYVGDAEIKFSAPKNTPDGTNPVECAQTSALGRALGFAGYGSADSIASADEVARAEQTASQQKQQPALEDLVGRAKRRAKAIGAAQSAEEWAAMLEHLRIVEVGSPADVAKINGYLTRLEREAQEGQHN